VSDNNTRSTVEYRDIGIQLTVTPLIGVDGTVQMVIEQTIENVVENIEIDGNPQPIIGKREATSTISVKDGQIIVLGGLQENTGSDSNSYMPLVGRWPLIRNIFGGSSKDFERTEVIIFIRPRVLQDPDQAEALAQDHIEGASEKDVLREYLKNDTTGDLYLEGSRFEDREPTPDRGSRLENTPRSLRR
jgi:general secretion pathway protein D